MALQEMASATWDKNNNCVQQKEGDLLSQALKDLDIYDLRKNKMPHQWQQSWLTPLA